MRITVFTPTYNRAYIIENLYRSLQRQTFRDFEWIVIDDGSTDNTQELFEGFLMESNDFSIRYEKVENGGKHRAINRGVKMALGELFYIVDSDDYLPDKALEIIDRIEGTISESQKGFFAGICGQKEFPNGHDWGNSLDKEILDITSLEREKYNIVGDKAEVFYTRLLRRYPFPDFEGETFITESVVWDRIAADNYKLRFFNETVMYCDYLADGLSAKGNRLFYANPKGYALYLFQCALYKKVTGIEKWQLFLSYYYLMREKQRITVTAKDLHMNPIRLWLGLFCIRSLNRIKK